MSRNITHTVPQVTYELKVLNPGIVKQGRQKI